MTTMKLTEEEKRLIEDIRRDARKSPLRLFRFFGLFTVVFALLMPSFSSVKDTLLFGMIAGGAFVYVLYQDKFHKVKRK